MDSDAHKLYKVGRLCYHSEELHSGTLCMWLVRKSAQTSARLTAGRIARDQSNK